MSKNQDGKPFLTDLEVLSYTAEQRGIWSDVFYTTEMLPNLLNSGDIEIWVRDLYDLSNVAEVQSFINGDPAPYFRIHEPDYQRHVYTLPVGEHIAYIQAIDEDGYLVLELEKTFEVELGSDTLWAPYIDFKPEIVKTYNGPLEDCPRFEGTFTLDFRGLFDGAAPNIPLTEENSAMTINDAFVRIFEKEKLSNEPFKVTTKTIRNCNEVEGPDQRLGFVMEYRDEDTGTGFYANLYDTFENIDNRWPTYTWNRTDTAPDVPLCQPMSLDILTTSVAGRPDTPQNLRNIAAGEYGELLMRFETLYEQTFRESSSGGLVFIARFSPSFIDQKFTYNGVEQWVHTVGSRAEPECNGVSGMSSQSLRAQSTTSVQGAILFEPLESPFLDRELRRAKDSF